MKIGIQQYTVLSAINEIGLINTLPKLKECGCDAIETCMFSGFDDLKLSPQEFKEVLACNGLELWGNHFSKRLFSGPYEPQYKFLAAAGGKYVTYSKWLDYTSLEDIKNTAAFLNEQAKIAKNHGLILTYHNHSTEFEDLNGKLIIDLLEEFLSDDVKFETDVFFARCSGVDEIGYIKKHNDRIALLHLKQIDETGKSADLPDGLIDMHNVVSVANPQCRFILEQADFDKPLFESISNSITFIKHQK